MLWVTFKIFVGVEEYFSLTCQWYFYGCTLFFSPRLAFWISRKTLLVVLEILLSSTYKCVMLLSWIAEGSRSRTGKAMVPKSGLLSLVVNSVTEGKFSRCQLSKVTSNAHFKLKWPESSVFVITSHCKPMIHLQWLFAHFFLMLLFFLGVVPDVNIVPVNISYEKVKTNSSCIGIGQAFFCRTFH